MRLNLDTNVVLRLLVQDSLPETQKAERLLEAENLNINVTVLMEVAWVLRSRYHFTREEIHHALRQFMSLANVNCHEPILLATAFHYNEQGLEFADAVQLAQTKSDEVFVSFDRKLINKSKTFHPLIETMTPF